MRTFIFEQFTERLSALQPTARRRLLVHIARQLAVFAVVYVLVALIKHSWWRPALELMIVWIVLAIGSRARIAVRARRGPDN